MKPGLSLQFGVTVLLAACVPSGSAPPYDAGSTSPTAAATFKPSANVMVEAFEDNFDRPDAAEGIWAPFQPEIDSGSTATAVKEAGAARAIEGGAGDAAVTDAGALLLAPSASASASSSSTSGFGEDAGSEPKIPSNLGPNWIQAKTSAWRVENGKLCGQGAHNHGVWLNKTLPVNARIEFDAIASNDEGDLKCEVWGDGKSFATGTSYTNATSYLAIMGGWKNTLHVLARLNEHGSDRRELPIDRTADDPRQRPVVKGQVYHFKIERSDGKTIHFFVDGLEYHKWTDPNPLVGAGHDHFAFNEWEAKVCFDNVKVTPLP